MSLAFNFTAVAVISSISSLYPTALAYGGPLVLFWSWIAASILTIVTAHSMAEISSAYPSAGGVAYWAQKMAPSKLTLLLSYATGWLNLIGNLGADAFFAVSLAEFTSYCFVISGIDPLSQLSKVALGVLSLISWGIINLLRIDVQGSISSIGAIWQVISTLGIIGILSVFTAMMPNRQASVSDIIFQYYNNTSYESSTYVCLLGTLCSTYAFTGYKHSNVKL